MANEPKQTGLRALWRRVVGEAGASSARMVGALAIVAALGMVGVSASGAVPAAGAGLSDVTALASLAIDDVPAARDASDEADEGDTYQSGTPSNEGDSSDDSGSGTSSGTSTDSGTDGSQDSSASSSSSSSSGQSSDTAENAGGQSGESAQATDGQTADERATRVLECKVVTADGVHFTVKVAYDEAAGIPEGAQLHVVEVQPEPADPKWREDEAYKDRPLATERFASKVELVKQTAKLVEGLKVQKGEHVFYTKFLDVSIVANGAEVQPAAPVEVTIETDAVERSVSDAIEVALYAEGMSAQFAKTGYAPVEVKNKTEQAKDPAHETAEEHDARVKLVFETDQVGDLGLAGIAKPLATRTAEGTDVQVMGPRSMSAWAINMSVSVPEGDELIDAFYLENDPYRDYGTTFWLQSAGTAGVAAYRVSAGELQERLFGAAGTAEPVALSDKDGVALVRTADADEPASAEEVAATAAAAQAISQTITESKLTISSSSLTSAVGNLFGTTPAGLNAKVLMAAQSDLTAQAYTNSSISLEAKSYVYSHKSNAKAISGTSTSLDYTTLGNDRWYVGTSENGVLYNWYKANNSAFAQYVNDSNYKFAGASIDDIAIDAIRYGESNAWQYQPKGESGYYDITSSNPVVTCYFQYCSLPVITKTTSKGNLNNATTVYEGSVWPGYNDTDIQYNVNKGNVSWPYEYYTAVIGTDRDVVSISPDGTYKVSGSSESKPFPADAQLVVYYNYSGSGTSEDDGGTGGGGGGGGETTDKPIKVTDGDGKVLYLASGDAALFDDLDSAFAKLGNCYTTAEHTTVYTGVDYQVMMLTSAYTQTAPVTHASGSYNVVLTTEDGSRPGGSCTITNGGVTERSLITSELDSLTIENIAFDGNSVKMSSDTVNSRGAFIEVAKGSLTVSDSSFANGHSGNQGGALFMGKGTTLTVNTGVSFTNNTATGNGGAIAADAETAITINDATFSGNTANRDKYENNGYGGAICLFNEGNDKYATLTVTNSSFAGNTAAGEGGAIRTAKKAKVALTGCSFIDNEAQDGGGGAVIVNSNWWPVNSSLTIDGGTFQQNTAPAVDKAGGAVRLGTAGTLTVTGDALFGGAYEALGNSASKGGAISVAPGATLNFESGTVKYNKADAGYMEDASGTTIGAGGVGGGIHLEGWLPTINMTGGTIANNSASAVTVTEEDGSTRTDEWGNVIYYGGRGGGIYCEQSKGSLTNVTIEGCSADYGGGALFVGDASRDYKVVIEGGDATPVSISSCTAGVSGGAIFAQGDFDVTGNVTIDSCKAPVTGGAVCMSNGNLVASFKDCTIKNCASTGQSAGGIYCWSASTTLDGCTMTGNSANWSGGCICAANPDGTVLLKDCTMTGNTGGSGSVGWVCNGGNITVDGGTYKDNYAWGGVFYANNETSKLYFQNDAYVYDNHPGQWDSTQCNVYLNNTQPIGVINTTDEGLGADAKIGVYVIDERFEAHGGVNDPFGTYASSANLSGFVNDRNGLLGGTGYEGSQIVWRQPVKVEVRYVKSLDFANVPTDYTVLYSNDAYNFTSNESMSIADVAAELRGQCAGGTTSMEFWQGYSYDNAGSTLLHGSYWNYLTALTPFGITTDPNTPPGTWGLVSRYNTAAAEDVQQGKDNTLVLYFTEPVYFTIRNASDFPLSYYNNGTLASGSFTVDAKVVTQGGLVDFTQEALNLAPGTDVTLKVLGGAGASYTFGGGFSNPTTSVNVTEDGAFKMILENSGNAPNVWGFTMEGTLTSSPEGYTTLVFGDGAAGSRRVIIRKVDGANNVSLAGATFSLMSASRVTIESGLTSGPSGVFYIGELHAGTYYLVEDVSPSGYEPAGYSGNTRVWYEVTVTDSAVTISEPRTGDVSGWGGGSGSGSGSGSGQVKPPVEELGTPTVGEECTATQSGITAANWGRGSFTWRQGEGYVYGECSDGFIAVVYVNGTYYLPYAHYEWTENVPMTRVSPTHFFAEAGFAAADLADGATHTYTADDNDWNYAQISWEAYSE